MDLDLSVGCFLVQKCQESPVVTHRSSAFSVPSAHLVDMETETLAIRSKAHSSRASRREWSPVLSNAESGPFRSVVLTVGCSPRIPGELPETLMPMPHSGPDESEFLGLRWRPQYSLKPPG